jgi:hypothetical protein
LWRDVWVVQAHDVHLRTRRASAALPAKAGPVISDQLP